MKRLRIALLIGLFLVPVLLHGHRHDTLGSSAQPCAVCVAAHHSPALGAPAVAVSSPAIAVHSVHARPATAHKRNDKPQIQRNSEAPRAVGAGEGQRPVLTDSA